MADSAYSEWLMAQLDGVRLVRYDAGGLLRAWFGGHGVHVYDAGGAEVDYWSVGDFAKNYAELEEVEESMARHILNVDQIVEQAEQEGYERGVAAGSWLLDEVREFCAERQPACDCPPHACHLRLRLTARVRARGSDHVSHRAIEADD